MNATNTASQIEQHETHTATVEVPVDQLLELHKTIDRLSQTAAPAPAPAPDTSTNVGRDAASEPAPRRRTTRKERDPMNTATVTAPGATGSVPGSNVAPLNLENMLIHAKELGEQAGLGKDTQIKFAMLICQSAFAGQLDLLPNKHGKDVSDAVKLAEAYVKAQNSAVIFDSKAPNQRKLISNLNKCIKLGGSPKFGVGQPMGNINDLLTLRQNLRKVALANGGKLDDAFNTLMRYATAQLKEDQLIVGDDLKEFCYRKQPEPRTAEEVLRAMQKMATNLKVGKVSNCPDLDNSKEVLDIITLCNKRISAIAKAKGGNTTAP